MESQHRRAHSQRYQPCLADPLHSREDRGCITVPAARLVIGFGVTLSVINGSDLAVYSELDNYGTLNVSSGASLTNYGIINNYGTIEAANFANLPFTGQGTVNNFANGALINDNNMDNYELIVNNGTLDNSGNISECAQVNVGTGNDSILYCGTIENFGTVNCYDSCSIETTLQTTWTQQRAVNNSTSTDS